ncbi:alpha/beta hydrolase [Candidatus Leptofilum sp.]|uniref:alpha/beta hydrolase n=1 Tax=Candidatus Leptofilum sp. TaxID=3241576 RepID=UPI003B596724
MQLPIGYQPFHKISFFNYQMNRLHALGYARQDEIQQAAAQIKTRADYVSAFLKLADVAKVDGRLKNAASYLRAAEFFAEHNSPQRKAIYQDFQGTFYAAFADEDITRHEVPYGGSCLPAMTLPSAAQPTKGTILLFGGFDSLIEEFFVIWKFFAEAGYRVIAFEGPGQGGARQQYNLAFDHDWEKPVRTILDYFEVEAATLIGISMGGYWAIRAAAFEKRIQRVVSWSPVYDWLEQIPGFAQKMVQLIVRWEGMMNATIRLRMRLFPILDHAVNQAMYMVKKDQPMDAVRWLLGMNKDHLHSDKVTQDVLLVGGENDAFQPIKLLHKQQAALVNARSVATRIFTKAENADMHCQMGNLNLAMSEIESWLRQTSPTPAEHEHAT